MHLKNKIVLFKVSLIAGLLFLLGFAVLFFWNSKTVKDAEYWSRHTDIVLDEFGIVEAAIKTADHLGKVPLIEEQPEELAEARTRAVQLIERFRNRVSDNPEQVANVDALRDRLAGRIAAQNKQAVQMRREGDEIAFKRVNVLNAIDTSFTLEGSLAEIRKTERILHHNREVNRTALKWQLIYGMMFCSILFVVAIGVTLQALWQELQTSREAQKSITKAIHNSEMNGGTGAIPEAEAKKLLKLYEEGFAKLETFKTFFVTL